jgi:uncharacterized OB-fold protein
MLIKNKRKIFIPLLFLGIMTISSTFLASLAKADAGDVWGAPSDPQYEWGWVSPEGYNYYERYRVLIPSQSGSPTNEPVAFNPWFPDYRARLNGLRILYESDSGANHTELPYITQNVVNYASGHLKSVKIIFVAPIIGSGKMYYLAYSDNISFTAPDYTGEFSTIQGNIVDDFYDHNTLSFVDTLNAQYNAAGNQSAEILVPNPGAGLDVNVTSAKFNITINPTFYEESTIDVDSKFDGMGPTSVKIYDGSVYGSGDDYLLIGGPNKLYAYQYTAGSWSIVRTVPVPQNASGALVSGMHIGNTVGLESSDPELIFGIKNGSVLTYSFDGAAQPTIHHQINMNKSTNDLYKPYGITSLNIYSKNGIDLRDDLVVAGSDLATASSNIYTEYNNNTVIENYETKGSYDIGAFDRANNYSYLAYSQANHGLNSENFFVQDYDIDSGDRDVEEFMLAFPQNVGGTDYICAGIYEVYTNALTSESRAYPRLKEDINIFGTITQGTLGGIAYSKKLTNDQDLHTIMAGGTTVSNDLVFTWKKLFGTQNSSTAYGVDDYTQGYMTLNQEGSILYPSYGNAVLTPAWGNLDDDDTNYDDVLFVDNNGKYHYFTYDATTQGPVRRLTGTLLDDGLDLYGTGQSIDAYDYSGDGIDDVIVGDNNGVIHMLNFSFASDIKIWSQYDTGASDYNQTGNFAGTFKYEDNINETDDMASEFNNYMGKSFRTVLAKSYTNCSVNLEMATPGSVIYHSLSLTYETNDYSLVSANRYVSATFDTSLKGINSQLQWVDFDQDGLLDYWENQGKLVWDAKSPAWNGSTISTSSTFKIHIDEATFATYAYNDTLPAGLQTTLFNGDSDGDGIKDGVELLYFGTNPLDADTDNDYLTDSFEINHPVYELDPLKRDTDGDLLYDNQELTFGSNPNNTNTDGDSVIFTDEIGTVRTKQLSDYDEVITYGTNPAKLDSDGDGLSDLTELGLWNETNELSHFLNSEKTPNGIYGATIVYAKTNTFITEYFPSLLPNLQIGLSPNNNDSDGDGLSDYFEIKQGFSFRVDLIDKLFYSNPLKNDTDGDGLLDGREINFVYSYWEVSVTSTVLKTVTGALNPDDSDSDDDGLNDGAETMIHFTNPLRADTDGDKLLDGEEINGILLPGYQVLTMCNPIARDTDGDGLLDGEEVYGTLYSAASNPVYNYFGKDPAVKLFSDPTKNDTDGDGWSDYYEVMTSHTAPNLPDTDGDGVNDKLDQWPVLNNALGTFYYVLVGSFIGIAVVAIPLNRYSASKALARKFLYQEKLKKSTKRMERERQDARAFECKAGMIPTEDPHIFSVKLTMMIKDKSFLGRACRVSYSAGAKDFELVEARKDTDEVYIFKLNKIPVDTRVLYYVEFLDRGGIWVRDDNDGKYFTFATNKDGTIDTKDEDEWEVSRGQKCTVCGYTCLPEWDECPECGTPLHDDPNAAILMDDQKKKKEVLDRERDMDAIAWEEAQQTDEVWRGLPPCPNCGVSVQPEWAACPVCNHDLTKENLKKSALYSWEEADMDFIEGKEEEEIKTEYKDDTEKTKSEKELLDELDEAERKKKEEAWNVDTDDDVDIL